MVLNYQGPQLNHREMTELLEKHLSQNLKLFGALSGRDGMELLGCEQGCFNNRVVKASLVPSAITYSEQANSTATLKSPSSSFTVALFVSDMMTSL